MDRNNRVYVIANTRQEDFIIRAVTSDKELADDMYAKLTEKYRGTDFESDLEMLEFSQEDSFSLLGQGRYQGKKSGCAMRSFNIKNIIHRRKKYNENLCFSL